MIPATVNSVGQLSLGAKCERRVTFSSSLIEAFSTLVDDHAPVHFDQSFAQARGFSDRIVHGFLVASMFSGMLGEQIPGPQSVINALSLKIHRPVILGDTIIYTLAVEQISSAVNAVVLSLMAVDGSGNCVLSGKATCSFPGAESNIGVRNPRSP